MCNISALKCLNNDHTDVLYHVEVCNYIIPDVSNYFEAKEIHSVACCKNTRLLPRLRAYQIFFRNGV